MQLFSHMPFNIQLFNYSNFVGYGMKRGAPKTTKSRRLSRLGSRQTASPCSTHRSARSGLAFHPRSPLLSQSPLQLPPSPPRPPWQMQAARRRAGARKGRLTKAAVCLGTTARPSKRLKAKFPRSRRTRTKRQPPFNFAPTSSRRR